MKPTSLQIIPIHKGKKKKENEGGEKGGEEKEKRKNLTLSGTMNCVFQKQENELIEIRSCLYHPSKQTELVQYSTKVIYRM